MATVTATKRFEWDMGHRLGDGYKSKCKHLHGHRYRCEVTIEAPQLDRYGMVLDFGDIKKVCDGWVQANLDHATLVCERDVPLWEFLQQHDQRHHLVDFNTTAENIVAYLANKFQSLLLPHDVDVLRVRLYETPNSYCDWEKCRE